MKHIMPFGRLDAKKPDKNKNTLTLYSLPDWQYFSIIHWYVSSREHSHNHTTGVKIVYVFVEVLPT